MEPKERGTMTKPPEGELPNASPMVLPDMVLFSKDSQLRG